MLPESNIAIEPGMGRAGEKPLASQQLKPSRKRVTIPSIPSTSSSGAMNEPAGGYPAPHQVDSPSPSASLPPSEEIATISQVGKVVG